MAWHEFACEARLSAGPCLISGFDLAGDGEARGVEGQVQQLLHDAQDPDFLSRMYVGWAAWL